MTDSESNRRGGWAFHSGEIFGPLDYVARESFSAGDLPIMLHLVYTDDGLYVPALVRKPVGNGPFPAMICMHGGSGGLGISYLVDQMLNRGFAFDRFLAEGFVVVFTEGRREIEEAYGTDLPAPLDHNDLIATFRYIQQQPFVDPKRVAFFGVSHGGEMQMKLISELQAGPAALVPGEPAVIEYLGLHYTGERKESNLQFNGHLENDQIDYARARQRIERISPAVPILVLGRNQDHLQGLFHKLYELLALAGKHVEWATWDHPEHAYQLGPRRSEAGYKPDPTQLHTLDAVVAFLNRNVRDKK